MSGSITIVRADGETLTFDAVAEYVIGRTVTVTSHPTESDAEFSDHAQMQPVTLNFRGVVTETPWRRIDASGGLERIQRAEAFLLACLRTIVSVVSARNGTFASMTITRVVAPINKLRDIHFEIEIRQVRIAVAEIVTLPGLSGSSSGDVGEQAAIDAAVLEQQMLTSLSFAAGATASATATTPKTDADRSALASLVDAVAGW